MYEKKLHTLSVLRDCNGKTFEVAYYITRQQDGIPGSGFSYGISIEKGRESFDAEGCFHSEENALMLLDRLAGYDVTPVSAEEVMYPILEQCDFRY